MDTPKHQNVAGKKILSAEKSAQAIAKAQELASHSIEQSKTAYKLCSALALERVKLLTPETDAHDIQRLSAHMHELIDSLKDPTAALARAAEKGELEFRIGWGEPRASKTMRDACKAVLLEIEGAKLGAVDALKSRLAPETDDKLSQPRPPASC
jgi:hypothetical protein